MPVYGRQYHRVPRGADPVERARRVWRRLPDFVGIAVPSCEKPVRHGKTDPDDTGVLSRGAGFTCCAIIARTVFCTDGAEYQRQPCLVRRSSFILWCIGSPPGVSCFRSAEGSARHGAKEEHQEGFIRSFLLNLYFP